MRLSSSTLFAVAICSTVDWTTSSAAIAQPPVPQSPAAKALEKPAAEKPKDKEGNGDLNKQVEEALKELEKIAPPPPAPRQPPLGGMGGARIIRLSINGRNFNLQPNNQQPNQPAPLPNPPPSRLGVSLQTPTAALAQRLNLPQGVGQIVRVVRAGSAAEKAGIEKNDVLVEFGGKAVPTDAAQFAQMIREAKAGVPIEVAILRNGQRQVLKNLVLPQADNPPQ